jgi:hypothetical protein
MKEIRYLPSDKSPEVLLSPDGIIIIKGRGFMLNNSELPQKISDWIDEYVTSPDDSTHVILAFEYLNSFTTIILIGFLRKLTTVLELNKNLKVKWYYEEGDNDILERGEHISATVKIPFEFLMTS